MLNMKKIISVILSSLLLVVLISGMAFAETGPGTTPASLASSTATTVTDVNKMASSLNKLNILQGTNGDYQLNSKIDRAQATALIIRMLGKENYVKQNAEQLKYTKFTDVTASSWYAPYVGYSTLNNIVGGNPDGKFAPKEYISEKSFLKMALCALGYIYNIDFDWSNVYQKSYSVGIVIDPLYATRTQDNTNYLRAEAVKALYRSLNTLKKGTQTKMAYTLADEGVFTREAIVASGVLGEDKATVIDLVSAMAANSIEVNLNENIQNVNVTDISIVDSSIANSTLAVQSVAFANDKIQVVTAGQIPGRKYILTINSVTDANGNISGKLTGSFNGFAQQQVNSEFFRISKAEQASGNVINVYFTHPVNVGSESPVLYELTKNGVPFITGSSQNMTVKKLQTVNNAVSIYLKNATLAQGEVYGLKISGKLTSSYGVKLGDGFGESMDFVTTAAQTAQLEVTSVQAWSVTSVRMIFNRQVDPGWAGKRLNYTVYNQDKTVAYDVTGAVVSESGEYSGREVMLTLALPLDKTKQYELKVEFVPDVYMQSKIEGKSFSFSGAYPANSDFVLNQAVSDYNNCAVLIFNKAADVATVTNKNNYMIRGVTDGSFNIVPEKVYYTEQFGMYMAKLYLPVGKTFSNTQKYTVYASGIKDAMGSNQPALLRGEFTGGSNSIVKPQITDAVAISKDTIKLWFNIEIAFDMTNISNSNYSLEYVENGETIRLTPIGVTYIDANTLVLRFDELNSLKAYQLRFNSMKDYSGINIRTAADGGNTIAVRWGK